MNVNIDMDWTNNPDLNETDLNNISSNCGYDILIGTNNGEEVRRAYQTKPWPSDSEIYNQESEENKREHKLLKFTGIGSGIINIQLNGTVINPENTPQFEYKYDISDSWEEYTYTLNKTQIDGMILTLAPGKSGAPVSVELRGISSDCSLQFTITGGNVEASGDITSLINGIGGDCELSADCYQNMFMNCTSLTQAPELPATTLASRCYYNMFKGCTSLTTSPVLPATTLDDYCYARMFNGCTSLTQAPTLPATTLAVGCYQGMFDRCTSLTQAPELPATTLAQSCYSHMFNGCTGLTTAPNLPATTLIQECYSSMFQGCTSLNYIKAMFLTNPKSGSSYPYTDNWVYGVSQTGTFVGNDNAEWYDRGVSSIPVGWETNLVEENPLTFTANTAGSTVNLSKSKSSAPTLSLEYSTDGGSTWSSYPSSTSGQVVTLLNVGDTVKFRGTNSSVSTSSSDYNKFSITGSVSASGDVTTLLNPRGVKNLSGRTYCFYKLFEYCTGLTTAPELLATTLADYCYSSMFVGCTGLTTAPNLPATTLIQECYSSMFVGCTGLTTAPELPATTLQKYCYSHMFRGCTSLTAAPELPATTLASSCYGNMFYGCTSLTTAPELPATTLADNCYVQMFNGCTSLTTAPELPATTLQKYCYSRMFQGCTSLNYIKAMLTTEPSGFYTDRWVDGVAATGTFVKNSAATWNVTGVNGIPEGWTVQDETT